MQFWQTKYQEMSGLELDSEKQRLWQLETRRKEDQPMDLQERLHWIEEEEAFRAAS